MINDHSLIERTITKTLDMQINVRNVPKSLGWFVYDLTPTIDKFL